MQHGTRTKRQAINGGEADVFSRYWRKMLCYTQRPGVTSKIKRGARRRERHQAAQHIKHELAADSTSAELEHNLHDYDDGSEWWWLNER